MRYRFEYRSGVVIMSCLSNAYKARIGRLDFFVPHPHESGRQIRKGCREYDQLFLNLLAHGHIKNLQFELPLQVDATGKPVTMTISEMDLYSHDQVIFFMRGQYPPVEVESDLDWLRMTGYARLACEGRVVKKKLTETLQRFKKPTSKKSVLKSWEYQS